MKIKSFWQKHGSTVLTCMGAVGVIATAVTAVRATPKALELIKRDSKKNHDGDPHAYTKAEAIKSSWKCYIFPVSLGVSTIVCIFGANILNHRQQANLASGYALIANAYQDYKRKVVEIHGKDAHERIMKELAVEKAKDVVITAPWWCGTASIDFEDAGEESRLFYDSYSKRYFETTISKVLQAEYHLNRNFALGGFPTLNDYYDFLGLEHIEDGDEQGWSSANEYYWIDFDHYKTLIDDELECYIIDMIYEPTPDFMDDI